MRNAKGFTLVELMIVVVIVGILAALAIPNFIAMQARAKEASVKGNMHRFQMSSEDYAMTHEGVYAQDAAQIGCTLRNPFGASLACIEDRSSMFGPMTSVVRGVVSYGDSLGRGYVIKANGDHGPLRLVLSGGDTDLLIVGAVGQGLGGSE